MHTFRFLIQVHRSLQLSGVYYIPTLSTIIQFWKITMKLCQNSKFDHVSILLRSLLCTWLIFIYFYLLYLLITQKLFTWLIISKHLIHQALETLRYLNLPLQFHQMLLHSSNSLDRSLSKHSHRLQAFSQSFFVCEISHYSGKFTIIISTESLFTDFTESLSVCLSIYLSALKCT